MKIPKVYKHEHVACLPKDIYTSIMQAVSKEVSTLLLTDNEKQEAIENAECSKVCDLTDTILLQFV